MLRAHGARGLPMNSRLCLGLGATRHSSSRCSLFVWPRWPRPMEQVCLIFCRGSWLGAPPFCGQGCVGGATILSGGGKLYAAQGREKPSRQHVQAKPPASGSDSAQRRPLARDWLSRRGSRSEEAVFFLLLSVPKQDQRHKKDFCDATPSCCSRIRIGAALDSVREQQLRAC